MRKYRGKRVDNGEWVYDGEWVYGYLIGNDVIVGEIVEITDEYFCTEWWWRVDPKTIGQSTGLKVKDGTEIFAGDVIEESASVDVFRYHVVWNKTDATFEFVDIGTGETFYVSDLYLDNSEIIGNSIDNPELWR